MKIVQLASLIQLQSNSLEHQSALRRQERWPGHHPIGGGAILDQRKTVYNTVAEKLKSDSSLDNESTRQRLARVGLN